MERKIGETFEYEGKTLKVKESENCGCHGCFFDKRCTLPAIKMAGECAANCREDNKGVVFVEVQEQPQKTEEPKERKIGDVFEYEGRKLKVVEAEIRCGNCFFHNGRCCTRINRTTGECKSSKRTDNESVVFIEITEEQAEQPQELNLCEILKDCPQGETFWSPMLDGVKFSCIDEERQMIIVETIEGHFTWEINADGTISIDEVTSPEIMLFPSRTQRDWTKVKYEKKKEKFDPKTLKPFDRVLAASMADGRWVCDFFSHIGESIRDSGRLYVGTGFGAYDRMIPYNDDTKHLVGTTQEAPDFYRYWED